MSKQEEFHFDLNHDVVEEYVKRVQKRKSEKWYKTTGKALEQWEQFLDEKNKNLEDANSYLIEDFDIWLRSQKNYADRTVRLKLTPVRNLCKYLVGRYDYDINVDEEDETDGIYAADLDHLSNQAEILNQKNEEIHYIEPETFHELVKNTDRFRDAFALRLLWFTGVRKSEAVEIKKDDIDRSSRSISVNTKKADDIKNRTVYYPRKFERLLNRWLDRGIRDSYMHAEDSEYLLVTDKSGQMSPKTLGDIMRNATNGLPEDERVAYTGADGREHRNISCHTLRHSYACLRVLSDYGQGSMPVTMLKKLMGHENIETTEEYTKVREEGIKEADRKYRP